MSIQGTITARDVVWNSRLIVRHFGPSAYLRCCVAILLGKRTTFLECVCLLT